MFTISDPKIDENTQKNSLLLKSWMKNDPKTGASFNIGQTKQVKLSKINIKNFDRKLTSHNHEEKEIQIREQCLNMLKDTRDKFK